MTDNPCKPLSNMAEMSVSELSSALKTTLEDRFAAVRVRGEIGRVSRPASGHVYLDLKDDSAVIGAVAWKGVAAQLRHQPEPGLEVIVSGRITTYPVQSRYQLVIESLEAAGEGALMALLQRRRRELAAEGLFDATRKKTLPFLPEVIGVVTSPTGSVVRDILHRLADRFPRRVLIWPVRVQGESCARDVAQAIDGFNALGREGSAPDLPRPDVIIVARGGGSMEDLWGFNEEVVVRAAARSKLPLISAIGHETDWSLLDEAADWRAPTPTAAAEKVVPVKHELLARLAVLEMRLHRAMRRVLGEMRLRLSAAARALPGGDDVLALARQRLDAVTDRLFSGLTMMARSKRQLFGSLANRLTARPLRWFCTRYRQNLDITGDRGLIALQTLMCLKMQRFHEMGRMLEALSHRAVLRRGFALILADDDSLIKSVADAPHNAQVALMFHDGRVAARIGGGGKSPRRTSLSGRKAGSDLPPEQGRLF